MAKEDRFLNTEEVADMLQVDEQTIRRWIKSGKLQAFKPGREWKIPQSALDSLVENYSSPKASGLARQPYNEEPAGPTEATEDPWKTQYEERGNEMFDKWEGELEEKIALADTNPAAFFDWVQEVRTFGRPFVRGLVAAYSSTDGLSFAAVSGVGAFLRDWSDLWHRIEEITTLSPDDERRLLEMAEEAKSLTSLDGNA